MRMDENKHKIAIEKNFLAEKTEELKKKVFLNNFFKMKQQEKNRFPLLSCTNLNIFHF